jgi:hypothetical protein
MALILSTPATKTLADTTKTRGTLRSPGVAKRIALLLFLLPGLSCAQAAPQEKEREPLGSLTSVGEVLVNDSLAPAEITVFSGDRVRVGPSGSATFNMSGKGSLKLSPGSQVLFTGKYEYAAQLEAGAVVMSSVSGPNGLTLRIGNDVLVPSVKEQTALASIDRAPDGSFLVTCSDGAMGVLALQGTSGQFLQVGQSVSVAPSGTLYPVEQPASSLPRRPGSSSGAKHAASYRGWTYLGLATAGAAGAAAALSHAGGKQSISPSSP